MSSQRSLSGPEMGSHLRRFVVKTRRSMKMDFGNSGIPSGTFILEMTYLAKKIGFFFGVWILNRQTLKRKAKLSSNYSFSQQTSAEPARASHGYKDGQQTWLSTQRPLTT